jgi:signal transduction histidine kinase
MDEQVRERIFTPFFSTKGGYATDGLNIPGRGLGLTIVSAILTEHRTSLDMESEPGKGTEIILHIPKEPGEDSDQGAFR